MAIKVEMTVKDRTELNSRIVAGRVRGAGAGDLPYRPLTAAAERILREILLDKYFAQLAQQLTTGSEWAPRALRGVTASELKTHLSAIPEAEAKWFGDLLASVQRDGLVEFEFPAAEQPHGGVPLPAAIAASLDKGEIKLADLNSPVLDLGDVSRYDLSKWQGKGK